MIDGVNIPTLEFDNFIPENIYCPIITYNIMSDTQGTLNNDLILVLGSPNKI